MPSEYTIADPEQFFFEIGGFHDSRITAISANSPEQDLRVSLNHILANFTNPPFPPVPGTLIFTCGGYDLSLKEWVGLHISDMVYLGEDAGIHSVELQGEGGCTVITFKMARLVSKKIRLLELQVPRAWGHLNRGSQ